MKKFIIITTFALIFSLVSSLSVNAQTVSVKRNKSKTKKVWNKGMNVGKKVGRKSKSITVKSYKKGKSITGKSYRKGKSITTKSYKKTRKGVRKVKNAVY